jgi:hypothetical protein
VPRTSTAIAAPRHLVVSLTGDSFGFVDQVLAGHGRARTVAVTVPNFMMALATIAETELITAVPRRFAAMHAGRYGLAIAEPPLTLPRFSIRLVASKAAMMDAGVNWMFETLVGASRTWLQSPANVLNAASRRSDNGTLEEIAKSGAADNGPEKRTGGQLVARCSLASASIFTSDECAGCASDAGA